VPYGADQVVGEAPEGVDAPPVDGVPDDGAGLY
jgi:hypothetical protein